MATLKQSAQDEHIVIVTDRLLSLTSTVGKHKPL